MKQRVSNDYDFEFLKCQAGETTGNKRKHFNFQWRMFDKKILKMEK
jgi:hypothetical protein